MMKLKATKTIFSEKIEVNITCDDQIITAYLISHLNNKFGFTVQLSQEDSEKVQEKPSKKEQPHSRACGIVPHRHGAACHLSCPSCQGIPNGE